MSLKTYFATYFLVIALTCLGFKVVTNWLYESSFDWVTCGESLNRANGSAAPQTTHEYKMWNQCVFEFIKRWDDKPPYKKNRW